MDVVTLLGLVCPTRQRQQCFRLVWVIALKLLRGLSLKQYPASRETRGYCLETCFQSLPHSIELL